MKILKLDAKGQTAVEYILLLLVMVSVIVSLLGYIKTKYLGDVTKCQIAANSNTLLCKVTKFVRPAPGKKPFQYYPFRK